MQVLDSYLLPPGCCALCAGNATPLIDTELNTDDLPIEYTMERSGWVYICVQCVFHMAAMLGGAGPEYVDRLKAELAEMTEQRDAARQKATVAQQALDAFIALHAGDTPATPEVTHAVN